MFNELNKKSSEKNMLEKNYDTDKTMIYLININKKKTYDEEKDKEKYKEEDNNNNNNNENDNILNDNHFSINKKIIKFQFLSFSIVKLIFFLIISLLISLVLFYISKNQIKDVSELLTTCDHFFNYYYYSNIYILLLKF